MQATVVDLRYRMNDILKALARNESVEILYHGKTRGVLKSHSGSVSMKVKDHPFFNMGKSSMSVDEEMARLREGRCHDL
jgi:hypothetical protein